MIINFEQNFNNKLNCNIFTTIRKSKPYNLIATDVEIHIQNVKTFTGRIIGQHKLKFKDISYEILMTDTGLILPTISRYLEVFKTWYPDWTMDTEVEILIIKHDKID